MLHFFFKMTDGKKVGKQHNKIGTNNIAIESQHNQQLFVGLN